VVLYKYQIKRRCPTMKAVFRNINMFWLHKLVKVVLFVIKIANSSYAFLTTKMSDIEMKKLEEMTEKGGK
jgi:hypothetical protein